MRPHQSHPRYPSSSLPTEKQAQDSAQPTLQISNFPSLHNDSSITTIDRIDSGQAGLGSGSSSTNQQHQQNQAKAHSQSHCASSGASAKSAYIGSPAGEGGGGGNMREFKRNLSPADLLLLLSPSVASDANLKLSSGPYSCDECGLKFPSLNALGRHRQISHSVGSGDAAASSPNSCVKGRSAGAATTSSNSPGNSRHRKRNSEARIVSRGKREADANTPTSDSPGSLTPASTSAEASGAAQSYFRAGDASHMRKRLKGGVLAPSSGSFPEAASSGNSDSASADSFADSRSLSQGASQSAGSLPASAISQGGSATALPRASPSSPALARAILPTVNARTAAANSDRLSFLRAALPPLDLPGDPSAANSTDMPSKTSTTVSSPGDISLLSERLYAMRSDLLSPMTMSPVETPGSVTPSPLDYRKAFSMPRAERVLRKHLSNRSSPGSLLQTPDAAPLSSAHSSVSGPSSGGSSNLFQRSPHLPHFADKLSWQWQGKNSPHSSTASPLSRCSGPEHSPGATAASGCSTRLASRLSSARASLATLDVVSAAATPKNAPTPFAVAAPTPRTQAAMALPFGSASTPPTRLSSLAESTLSELSEFADSPSQARTPMGTGSGLSGLGDPSPCSLSSSAASLSHVTARQSRFFTEGGSITFAAQLQQSLSKAGSSCGMAPGITTSGVHGSSGNVQFNSLSGATSNPGDGGRLFGISGGSEDLGANSRKGSGTTPPALALTPSSSSAAAAAAVFADNPFCCSLNCVRSSGGGPCIQVQQALLQQRMRQLLAEKQRQQQQQQQQQRMTQQQQQRNINLLLAVSALSQQQQQQQQQQQIQQNRLNLADALAPSGLPHVGENKSRVGILGRGGEEDLIRLSAAGSRFATDADIELSLSSNLSLAARIGNGREKTQLCEDDDEEPVSATCDKDIDLTLHL